VAEAAEPAEPAPASNAVWFERARRVIPGGVDSPVRSFASVGGTPYTVVSGDGAYVVDAEGNRYLDMVQSYGAVLLGHAHPVMTAAVTAAQALAFIDRPAVLPATANGTLEVVLPDWRWRRRTWAPHPACDCGAVPAAAGTIRSLTCGTMSE